MDVEYVVNVGDVCIVVFCGDYELYVVVVELVNGVDCVWVELVVVV